MVIFTRNSLLFFLVCTYYILNTVFVFAFSFLLWLKTHINHHLKKKKHGFTSHYALIPIFLEFWSSDLYYISKCRNDGPINESSLKNGPTIAIVRGLANIWFFTVLLLNRAILGMFEGVQEGIRTQFFCGEVKFNIIATSRNFLRLRKHVWRPLETA